MAEPAAGADAQAPGAAASLSSIFRRRLWAQSARHIRRGAATRFGYAPSRPPLAALIFLPIVYIWGVGVAGMALASWSITG